MDLRNAYIDFISVIPNGSLQLLQHQIKICGVNDLRCIYNELMININIKEIYDTESNLILQKLFSIVIDEIQNRMNYYNSYIPSQNVPENNILRNISSNDVILKYNNSKYNNNHLQGDV